jgi:hypothetical protein
MQFRLFVPKQAVGASLVYFDLFNASGSNQLIDVLSVRPVVSGEAAVTGTLGVDVFLTRTTAVGTGGTAATSNGTALNACTFTGVDHSSSIPTGVTARLTPTGGATAGAVLGFRGLFTEETNAGTYSPAPDLAYCGNNCAPILLREGQGIRVVQGAVASVGNIGFDVLICVRNKV